MPLQQPAARLSLAVVTPSHRKDLELCRDLHASVLAYTPVEVVHHLVVPPGDVALFSDLAGERCRVWSERDLLPRNYVLVPWLNRWVHLLGRRNLRVAAIDLRRPLLPVRGWILQQALKIRMADVVDDEVLLLLDSDVQLIRPLRAEDVAERVVRLYREDDGIDATMTRHVTWHKAARALLGLPDAAPPFPDYVSSLMFWDRRIVLGLRERLEHVTGRSWWDAITGQVQISEWTLYGVYVDEVLGAPHNGFASADPLCHSYWEEVPLDAAGAARFVADARPEDLAVMISAKSSTSLEVRRRALAR